MPGNNMQIVPARRGQAWNSGRLPQQVINYIQQGNITRRQGSQLAKLGGNAMKSLLNAFLKQNSGGDAHDKRRGPVRRARQVMAKQGQFIHRMPQGHSRGMGWDAEDFASASMGDLLNKSWSISPATSNLMAPRGLGYYDAFANHPVSAITHLSIGPATPISAKTRIPSKDAPNGIDTGLKYPQLLIIGPAPTSTQAQLYFRSSAIDIDNVGSTPFQASALPQQTSPNNGPPDDTYLNPGGDLQEVIPVRCSVRVRNFTAEINRGGQVHVLRLTTGLALMPPITTNADFDDLLEGIRDHARTRTYDGADFGGTGLQKNCTVADQSRALMFQNFNQCTVSSDVNWVPDEAPLAPGAPPVQFPVYPVDVYHYDPTFTPIAILFEPFKNVQPGTGGPIGNTYGVTVQSQFLAHYKQGTMLANMAFNPSNDKDGKTLNTHRDKEEMHGSTFHKIMDYVKPVAQTVGALAPFIL
jgi:hypothetical protein